MALSHYLFADTFRDMQRAMNAFDQAFFKPAYSGALLRDSGFSRFPVSDMVETPEGYEVHAELPGYDKKNINITLNDSRTLVLSGSHDKVRESGSPQETAQEVSEATSDDSQAAKNEDQQVSKNENDHHYWVKERVSGSFQRSFSFPAAIDPESIKANFENGVLKITVSKVAKKEPRQIQIE